MINPELNRALDKFWKATWINSRYYIDEKAYDCTLKLMLMLLRLTSESIDI